MVSGHPPLSERDRQMIASMPGSVTCYVDLVMFDPEGEFAGWEQRPTEIFLDRELDYERLGRHLCVLPPATCIAWVEERKRMYARMLAAGYRLEVSYHWNEFEKLPLAVYDAMRRDRWQEQEEVRTGICKLTVRQQEANTIKMVIADLFSLDQQESEAKQMQELLKEKYDIEIVQDASDQAIYNVSRYGLPWQDYHTVKQAFKLSGDKWSWEEERQHGT